ESNKSRRNLPLPVKRSQIPPPRHKNTSQPPSRTAYNSPKPLHQGIGSQRAYPSECSRGVCMLHSNLHPAFGCDGELIDLPERSTRVLTVKRCVKCWTELSWIADDGR